MASKPIACAAAGTARFVAYARRTADGSSELVLHDRTRGAGRVIWSALDEGEPDASIDDIAVNADGRLVAFVCSAGETGEAGFTINPYADLHLYDTATERRTRFGAAGELDPILGAVPLIREVALSADGEVIAFVAEKAGGFPGQADVFAFDRRAGLLTQANHVETSPCRNVAISGDGSAVFFTDAAGRLHVRELAGRRTRALPITIAHRAAGAHYSVSEDGRFIAFTSEAYGEQGEVRLFDRRTGDIEAALPHYRRIVQPAPRRRSGRQSDGCAPKGVDTGDLITGGGRAAQVRTHAFA